MTFGGTSGDDVKRLILELQATDQWTPAFQNAVREATRLYGVFPELDNALAKISGSFTSSGKATGSWADANERATKSLVTLVSEAGTAAQNIEKYSRAQALLNQQLAAGEGQQSAEELEEMAAASTLAGAAVDQLSEKIGKLPEGAVRLSQALKESEAAWRREQGAMKSASDTASQTARNYKTLSDRIAQEQRVLRELQAEYTKVAGAAPGTTPERGELRGAVAMSAASLRDLRAQYDQLTPAQKKYAQTKNDLIQQIREEERATRAAASAHQVHNREVNKTEQTIKNLGRGLAASIFSFSLLAGGAVAFGHLIGNVFNTAVEAAGRLNQEVADISALNPRLNTDDLYQDLTDLEARVGLVSEKIADIYKIAAPAAGGDEAQTLALTEQLIGGFRGARQNPASWAIAATETLRAYNLELTETERVQDILTYAMQNSAGQGSKLLEIWGSVTKAAANAKTPLEENAAVMLVVARHGGDLEENMRAVKGAYDALGTTQAQTTLRKLQIASTDAAGSIRPLPDLIGDLSEKLSTLEEGDRRSVISTLFQDRDVRNVMTTLLGAYDELRDTVGEVKDLMGTSKAATEDYLDSAAAKTERLDAYWQRLSENIGKAIQNARDFFLEIARGMDMDVAGSDLVPGWADYNEQQQEAIKAFAREHSAMGGMPGVLNQDIKPEDFQRLREELAHLGNAYHDANIGAKELADSQAELGASMPTDGISAYVRELLEHNRVIGQAPNEYVTLINWQGKVLEGASDLQPQLKGVANSINEVYQTSMALATMGDFGGFGSEAEQRMATLAEAMSDANKQLIIMMETDSRPTEGGFWGAIKNGIYDTNIRALIEHMRQLQQQAQDTAHDIQIQTPQYREDVRQWDQFREGQQATQALDAAQDALTATTKRYAAEVDGLRARQQGLQRALRDNSAPDLAAAYANLQRETKELEEGTARYEESLHSLALQMRDLRAEAEGVLAPLKAGLDSAQAALDNWNRGAGDVMVILGDQLYDLEAQAAATRRETEYLLQPLRDEAARTAEELQTLEDELADMRREFQESEDELRDTIRGLEDLRDMTLGPLRDQIQGLRDDLEDLNEAEQAALRPLQDRAYEQQQALQAIQDEIKALAAHYEQQLLPLQQEYNALRREEEEIARRKEQHDRRLSIENLTAQLANARPGSATALQLNRQIAELRNEDARKTRMGELESQIADIEEERDAAMRAAKEREEQAQRDLEATNRQIELLQRRYELERREIEDTLDDLEDSYKDQERAFSDWIDRKKDELDALERSHAATLKQKDADVLLAKTRAENARDALIEQEGVRAAIQKTNDDMVEAQQALISATQHTQEETRRSLQKAVDDAKAPYETMKGYYDELIDKLGVKITQEQFDATEFERSATKQRDDAKTIFEQIRAQYQLNIDKIGDQITAVQATASEAEASAQRVVAAEKEKQKALQLTYAWINAINTAIKSGVPIDPNTLPPEVRAWYEQTYGSQPTGDTDTGTGGTAATQPPASQQPPPHTSQPPPQGTGGHHGPNSGPNSGPRPGDLPTGQQTVLVPAVGLGRPLSEELVPVPPRAAGGGRVATGVVASVTIAVQVDAGALRDPLDPAFWERAGDLAFEGIQKNLYAKHGVRIATE